MSPTKWKNRNFFSSREDSYFLWSLYKLYLQFLPTNLPTLGFSKLVLHIFYFWVTISKTYSTWKPSYFPAYYLLVLVWLMRPHCLHTPWEKFFPVHSFQQERTSGRQDHPWISLGPAWWMAPMRNVRCASAQEKIILHHDTSSWISSFRLFTAKEIVYSQGE